MVPLLIAGFLCATTCDLAGNGPVVDTPPGRCVCNAEPDEESVKNSKRIASIVDAHWLKIKAAQADSPTNEDEDAIVEYWVNLAGKCSLLFTEMLTEAGDDRAAIELFVKKFATDGAGPDMRWFLCCVDCTIDVSAGGPLSADDTEVNARWRQRQILVAEFQTRRFMRDRKAFERYYECVIWSEFMFGEDWFEVFIWRTAKGIEDKSQYWWHARGFLALAHATGRDDLINSTKPEDLAASFREWNGWLKEDGPFLRPKKNGYGWLLDENSKKSRDRHQPFVMSMALPPLTNRPKSPFPDWKGVPPMPPRIFRRL